MKRFLWFLALSACASSPELAETSTTPSGGRASATDPGRYVTDLTADVFFTLLAWSDGHVQRLGGERPGETFEEVGARVRHVVIDQDTQCASTSDDEVWCGSLGAVSARVSLSGPGELVVGGGGDHACMVTGTRAECVVLHELADELSVPTRPISMLSLGRGHACGVVDGRAGCWGTGSRGALDGVRLRDDSETPVFPEGLDPTAPRAVRAGADRSCAVLRDGSLWCFGSYGMRWPNWNDPERTRAQRIPGTYVDVFLGDHHTCAVDEDGRPWCFGLASDGLLGPEVRADQRCEFEVADASPRVEPCTWRPTPIDLVHVVKMALGRFHSCAMDEGHNVFCWGSNEHGQIAFPPSPLPHYEPTLIARGLRDVGNGGGP